MNVNATLLVQTFNFLFAYLMFRFLLFKPACAVIEQEKSEKDALDHLIDQDERTLARCYQERHEQWIELKDYLQQNTPPLYIESYLFRHLSPKITLSLPDESELTHVTTQTSKQIIKAVEDFNERR